MRPEPGAVYRVDLGISGKVRFFVVVSRRDDDPPRAEVEPAAIAALSTQKTPDIRRHLA